MADLITHYTAVDIARIFVDKGIKDEIPVTQMKLQKLVYFANGIFAALKEGKEALFDDEIQAWDFGPIIPAVYHEYKIFGADVIKPENDFLRFIRKGISFEPIELTDDLHKKIVDDTWTALKDWSGIELSNWTHRAGSAWRSVYRQGVRNIPIPIENIVQEFNPMLIKNQAQDE